MDGAVDGAVTDIDGAIGLDGANPVDGALDVDGGPTDMDGGGIDIDGGMDIDGGATACVSNRGCAADEYCMHDTGECARFGVCAPRPGSRACDGEPVAPVCGCDGTTYDNACLAAASRVSVQSEGACAVEMMCPTTPPPAECCYGAADCGGGGLGGGVGVRCLGVDCSDDPAVAGVCKGRAPRGGCWSDDDCRIGGGTCVGAVICPCGAICESPDEAGTCSGP
ncbi:MAG: hypothetical protein IPK60_23245 [Sandaracinaceae bacterium]|nr:hypothetical protein [Sandaracinaceae bacterium]